MVEYAGYSGYAVHEWFIEELIKHTLKVFREEVVEKLEGEWDWDTRGNSRIGHPREERRADCRYFRKNGGAVVSFDVTRTSTIQIDEDRDHVFSDELIKNFAERWEKERLELGPRLVKKAAGYIGENADGASPFLPGGSIDFYARTNGIFTMAREVRVLKGYLE